jgi:hypothetical protein
MSNENRFDQAIIRREAAATAPLPQPASDALREALVKAHGELLGPLLYQAELTKRIERAERFERLRARHAVLQSALELRMAQQSARMAGVLRAFEEAQTDFLAATEALEQQRIADQSALVPLQNDLAEVIAEMNIPLFTDKVKNWGRPDGWQPDPPSAPPMPGGGPAGGGR